MVDFFLKNTIRDPVHYQLGSMTFGLYSKDEILKLSCVDVVNPEPFNRLGHPIQNGLYDMKMGPFTDRDRALCKTCHLNAVYCPGHIGHISLPVPVVNPLFYAQILKVLKITCLQCHRFKMADCFKLQFQAQIQLLNLGLINQAQEIGAFIKEKDDPEAKKEKMTAEEASSLELKMKEFLDTELRQNKGKVQRTLTGNRMVEGFRKDYVKQVWENGKNSQCPKCGAITRKILRHKTAFICDGIIEGDYDDDIEELMTTTARKMMRQEKNDKFELNAKDLMDHFQALYRNDKDMLDKLFPVLANSSLSNPTDMFFIEVLPVPPARSRPAQFTDGGLTLHPQSAALQEVIQCSIVVKSLLQIVKGASIEDLGQQEAEMIKVLQGSTPEAQLDNAWKELQCSVDHVLDKNLNSKRNDVKNGWGLKQLIERKQGIFRMNMMGKRVNHACRTVITPDPNVKIDEIGVPEVFAKRLSYPVPVTPWNVTELRELIVNGPEKHPGAVRVENELGDIVFLDNKDKTQRLRLANTLLTPNYKNKRTQRPKIVYRHLINGDAMLLNRQPTLHKPSIMAHKARVLKGEKVMRLHYSNCKSYNADFDGDEMNAHFPQSENARSEAYNIVMSSHQYLGPKDGTPLQGLIQDHVIGGVKMSLRGRFFTRAEYNKLVFQALQDKPGKIKTLPPTIIKPQTLWSGKQILSTILINLVPANKPPPNFSSSAKIRPKLWQNQPARKWKGGGKPEQNDISMTESEVIIRNGILCTGILDKNQYGATQYSLAHLLFELYGGQCCCDFLSGLSRMFTYFLQAIEGFTLGVEDILVRDDANVKRTQVMKDARKVGEACARQGVGAKGEVTPEELRFLMEESHRGSASTPRLRAELDQGYKEKLNPATNDINAVCVPAGLIKPFPHNNLQLMVNSGAKGSTVNTTQISALLGQIELEGKRPPIMISGKSLPSFKPYDTQPRAGGFIDGRFMTGIQPQEFFFHCMAGREGLIDTAVKTSRSGYLQRCLIKLLEGLVVHHDFTVRDSDNSVVQFQYGEDSLDGCKSQYLKPSRMNDLVNNIDCVIDPGQVKMAKTFGDHAGVKAAQKKLKAWKRKENVRSSAFLMYSKTMNSRPNEYEKVKVGKEEPVTVSRPKSYWSLHTEYRNLNPDVRADLEENTARKPDPVASVYPPNSNFRSITEVCDQMIKNYLKKNKEVDQKSFKDIINAKIQMSSVAPGEPVGVLAAQSVGEPSTQMTLNTFHFAGRGEMNVTLGIPRLREILMVASDNIKTPSLMVPFLAGVSQKEMNKFRLKFNRVCLSDVLEEVVVTESLKLRPTRERRISLKFKFIPHKYYKQDFGVNQSQVLNFIETKFFNKVFMPVLTAVHKEKSVTVDVSKDREVTAPKVNTEDEDQEEDNEKKMANTADLAMGDVDSSDDEQDLMEEGTDVSKKKERQEDLEYEELEEEELKIKEEVEERIKLEDEDEEEYIEEGLDPLDSSRKPGTSNKEERLRQDLEEDEGIEEDEGEKEEMIDADIQAERMSSDEPAKRRLRFLTQMEGVGGLCNVVDYSYDTEKEQWCEVTLRFDVSQKRLDMVNIIKKSAEKGVIHQVKNIKKAFIIEKDGEHQIQTDGINIDVMVHFDRLLDLNRLYCNNIHDMARYYGIESAYKTIVREVTNVFGVYGIEVDYRHLSLIADYMTMDGSYRPFNRIGMQNNPSPLQQMSFETAMEFLKSATLNGKTDYLSSPSACIVAGKTVKAGTGTVNLRYKL